MQPPIPATPDPEYKTRIEAERVTLEFGTKSTRRLDSGKQPMNESPLFGGPAQADLFGGDEDKRACSQRAFFLNLTPPLEMS